MAITTTYPSPVYVNGYLCRSCNDVTSAKRGVDPSDPSPGPGGVKSRAELAGALQRPLDAGAETSAAVAPVTIADPGLTSRRIGVFVDLRA